MEKVWAIGAIAFLWMPSWAAPLDDFVPGDREIFFDDFSKTAVGDFPDQWTLKGPGGGGNELSVAAREGRKFLVSQTPAEGQEQSASTVYVRRAKREELPEVFTIEFDAVLGYSRLTTDLKADKHYEIRVGSDGAPALLLAISSEQVISRSTQSKLDAGDGKVHRIAIRVKGASVNAYADGQRVIDDPEGVERPIAYVGIELSSDRNARQDDLMFTNFRIAELSKDRIAR